MPWNAPPGWYRYIIFSYLSQRTLIVKFKGCQAEPKALKAGTPEGTVLGVVIIVIKFNGACQRPPIPRNSSINNDVIAVKYIDDASAACSIDLKKTLISDPIERQRPLTLNENNQLILPQRDNPLQDFMSELCAFARSQNMSINEDKTKI